MLRKNYNLGPSNGKWAGGVSITDKGYRRIRAGHARNKYEHRHVMEMLLANPVGLVFLPAVAVIPGWATVHHIDHDKQHNCGANLMLLDHRIHNAISKARRLFILANYEAWVEYNRQVEERWE